MARPFPPPPLSGPATKKWTFFFLRLPLVNDADIQNSRLYQPILSYQFHFHNPQGSRQKKFLQVFIFQNIKKNVLFFSKNLQF